MRNKSIATRIKNAPLLVMVLLLTASGCGRGNHQLRAKATGTWQTKTVDSEWGEVVHTVTLKDNGQFSWVTADVEPEMSASDRIELKGTWRAAGGNITLDVSGGDRPVPLHLSGAGSNATITISGNGEVLTFFRKGIAL